MKQLMAPVDIATLVYFRIAFGAIMVWEVWRYFHHGWIEKYWVEPTFHFTYYGFNWVQPWTGNGMYLHFIGLGFLAICITVGLWYRISTFLFFIGFTYIFLLEQARYLNHFYLIILLSFLLILIPAHHAFSLDALQKSALRSDTAPAWALWAVRAQIGIVYFFGGVAKLNSDWLQGEPMRMWLARRTEFPLIGIWFTEEWMVALFNYGGLLLDLLIVPFLLWRPTRLIAFLVTVIFHVLNDQLFVIGIFPWFMIAATAMFFEPNWPRRLFNGIHMVLRRSTRPNLPAATGFFPSVSEKTMNPSTPYTTANRPLPSLSHKILLAGLAGFFTVQLVLPFRHHLYRGDVNWTEEGHRFAWHMKLREKQAIAQFYVTDSTTTWVIDPEEYLTSWQASRMATRPDMILQFSHYLADQMRQEEHEQIEVRAAVMASLNGREYQYLVDPTINLALHAPSLLSAPWIVPLDEPLK